MAIVGEKEIKKFVESGAEFMVVGGAGLLMQGMDRMTMDVDLYFSIADGNSQKIIGSLEELGYSIDKRTRNEILNHKDFIQVDGDGENLVDLDIMFYPDGFENFEEASRYKREIAGIPVMDAKGILISKRSANRKKDRAVISEIEDFITFRNECRKNVGLMKRIDEGYRDGHYFDEFDAYAYADLQTLRRWGRRIERGERNPFLNLLNAIAQ